MQIRELNYGDMGMVVNHDKWEGTIFLIDKEGYGVMVGTADRFCKKDTIEVEVINITEEIKDLTRLLYENERSKNR